LGVCSAVLTRMKDKKVREIALVNKQVPYQFVRIERQGVE